MTNPDAQLLTLRAAGMGDLDLLARLNSELIRDEGHRNPMSVAELRDRFERFLAEGWSVDLVLAGEEVTGYATYRFEADITEPSGRHLALRQFFLCRERRGGGLGRRAIDLLMRTRFASADRVVLEVLETNPGGRAFWERLGFTPYAAIMERRSPASLSGPIPNSTVDPRGESAT